ncbi:MAG: type II secretion system F family protein [Candidatus Micrarchaeota archaeon]|nr:type II secretion system F family protein [Candidatus Micrarchaeota archaeon]
MKLVQDYWKFWDELLIYNDYELDTRKVYAYFLLGSLAAGIVFSLMITSAAHYVALGALLFSFSAHIFAYTYLLLGANSRASKVEEVLPDFLALVASNIRAGLTPDKALLISAREEFGPLSDAIVKAGKSSITGMPLDQVMMGMTERIRSSVFEKTITMIVEGLHSGGDMAELLEKTALDIRKFRAVRREVNSIILNYQLFIVAAITFGAPLLYGVSTFLVDIMILIKSKIGAGSQEAMAALSTSVGIFKGRIAFTPEAVSLFAAAGIIITVFFGCIAIGIMSSGRRVDGLKYFPFLALIGLAILFGIRTALSALLGSMLAV